MKESRAMNPAFVCVVCLSYYSKIGVAYAIGPLGEHISRQHLMNRDDFGAW
jgi:hypothetical protein